MFHGHVILLENLVAVDFPSSGSPIGKTKHPQQIPGYSRYFLVKHIKLVIQVIYIYTYLYIYIYHYTVYIYIYHIYFISHIPMQCLLIEARGDPAGFIPTPQLRRPLHTRVSRLSRDRPTVVGGMWRLRAATSAAPAGLRWVKSSGLLQNNVENLWFFRMKHDRWLGVHIELQEGWDENDHGKKQWIFHGQFQDAQIMLLTIDPPKKNVFRQRHTKRVWGIHQWRIKTDHPPGPRVARPPIRAYQKPLYHQQPLTRCYDIVWCTSKHAKRHVHDVK